MDNNNMLLKTDFWEEKLGCWALCLSIVFLFSLKGTAFYNISIYLLMTSLIIRFYRKKRFPKVYPEKRVLFSYCFFCFCFLVAGLIQGETETIFDSIGYVYRTLIFFLLYYGVLCFGRKDIVHKSFIIASIVNAFIVIYWYVNVWDQNSRLCIIDNPNLTVEVLSLTLTVAILSIYRYRHNIVCSLFGVVSATILLVAMWWTQCRGGMAGFIAGVIMVSVCWWMAKRKSVFKKPVIVNAVLIVLGTALLLGVTAYLFPRGSSDSERICIYKSSVQMFVDNPLVGVGYENFSKEYYKYKQPESIRDWYAHAHNDFLQFLATTGIIGTVGYIVFSLVIFYCLVERVTYKKNEPIYLAMLCIFISMYLHGMVDMAMNYNTGVRIVFGMLGISLAIEDKENNEV